MREGAKPRDGGRSSHFERRQHFTKQVWLMVLLGWLMLVGHARAALQFDVYLGYDGMVREVNWFPAAFEIFNDGPAFNGVIELTNEQSGKGQARRVLVELPTNTRKRIVIPVFASAGKYAQWKAVLYDDKEKKRAEVKNLTTRRDINWNGILVGAITRSFGGQPVMPELGKGHKDEGLEVARLDPNLLPDSPIPLEGLQTIYLNTERALEISAPQAAALVSWLHAGGHLIVGVEQPGDLSGLPWLVPLMPVRFGGSQAVAAGRELENFAWTGWGVNLQNYQSTGKKREANPEFYETKLPVFQATLSDGNIMASAGSLPLVVQADRGRGKVTVLTFSPEREPFRSWKGRHWFWAQLSGVPAVWFTDTENQNQYYNHTSIDGPIGAMIDSKQVRKLPVSWLLLLLAVYLVVIGPLDQWWLKKINRQMLTWITFPCYVVGFSLLIYWIGFLLRAGESEWNEVHLVDVTSYGGKVDLRGRTYASCYSPSNAKYPVGVDVPHATFRGEFQGSWSSPQELSRTEVTQLGKGFTAELFVPVWTSQLYVSDWLDQGVEPLGVTLSKSASNYTIRLENKLKEPVQNAWLVIDQRVYELPRLGPGEGRQVTFAINSGQSLGQFVQQNTANFSMAASRRKDAFGDSRSNFLPNPPIHLAAASFLKELPSVNNNQPYQQRGEFILPGGFDLSEGLKQGQACVLAWAGGYSPIAALNKFESRRTSRDTLFRVMVPAPQ